MSDDLNEMGYSLPGDVVVPRDKITLPGDAVLTFEPGTIDVEYLLRCVRTSKVTVSTEDLREAVEHQAEIVGLKYAIAHSEKAIRRLRSSLRNETEREDRQVLVRRDALDMALIHLEAAVAEWKQRLLA